MFIEIEINHGTWFGIFKYGELSDLVRVKWIYQIPWIILADLNR